MENIIIGGDFNLYLHKTLDKINIAQSTLDNNGYREALVAFMENENLVDAWRILNPDKQTPTWNRNDQKSRLDYLLISDHLLNSIKCANIEPSTLTDHCLINLVIKGTNKQSKGRGFWKMNNSLLYDLSYIEGIKNTIQESEQIHKDLLDDRVKWELIKFEMRNFTIPYSITKSKERNALTQKLEKSYKELYEKTITNPLDEKQNNELQSIKQELEQHRKAQSMWCHVTI